MKKPHEQEWKRRSEATNIVDIDAASGRCVVIYAPEAEHAAIGSLISAASDMARAGLMLHARVAEAARSLPSARTADGLAEMDTSVTVPSSIIREVFAALRKAVVLE